MYVWILCCFQCNPLKRKRSNKKKEKKSKAGFCRRCLPSIYNVSYGTSPKYVSLFTFHNTPRCILHVYKWLLKPLFHSFFFYALNVAICTFSSFTLYLFVLKHSTILTWINNLLISPLHSFIAEVFHINQSVVCTLLPSKSE